MSRAGRAAAAPVALLDWLLVVAAAAGMLGLGTVAAGIGFADGPSTPASAVFGIRGDEPALGTAQGDASVCACGNPETTFRPRVSPRDITGAADQPQRTVAPGPRFERFLGEGPGRRELLLAEAESDPRWLLTAMARATRERHGVGYHQICDPFAGP